MAVGMERALILPVNKAENTIKLIFSVAEQNCAMHGVNTLGLASLSYLSKLGQGSLQAHCHLASLIVLALLSLEYTHCYGEGGKQFSLTSCSSSPTLELISMPSGYTTGTNSSV